MPSDRQCSAAMGRRACKQQVAWAGSATDQIPATIACTAVVGHAWAIPAAVLGVCLCARHACSYAVDLSLSWLVHTTVLSPYTPFGYGVEPGPHCLVCCADAQGFCCRAGNRLSHPGGVTVSR